PAVEEAMRVGRNLPQPLIEGQVVKLGESRGPAIHLLGRDAFDAAFDFRPGVGIARIQTAPVLLQVVVAKKPGANLVGQLDDFDPVRRHVLRARIQPDAVAVLLRMGVFLQYTVIGLTVGSFYALVALGYTIVYGIIRLINFAQGDLSMVGAFLGWTLLVSFGFEHLPIYLALVIAFVVPMIGT